MTDHFGNISINPGGESTPPNSSPTRTTRRSKKKGDRRNRQNPSPMLKITLSAVLVILLISAAYLIAGYWGVPKYLQSSLTEKFLTRTGMALQLGQVHFDPFLFHLEIENITVGEQQLAAAPLLSANSLVANIAPLPLLKGKLVTTKLVVDDFRLDIIRNLNGDFNYQPLLSNKSYNNPSEILDFSELPFLFSLNNIGLTNGTISIEDIPNGSSHLIEKIELTLPSFSNVAFTAKEYIQPSFAAVINGSPVQLTGKANFSENTNDSASAGTQLECEFNDINIPLYFAYLPDYFPFEITSGTGSGRFTLTFVQYAREDKLSVSFNISAREIKAHDNQSLHSLFIPDAQIEGTILPSTGILRLQKFVMRSPSLNSKEIPFQLSESKTQKADNTSGENIKATDLNLEIHSLEVDNGTFSLLTEPEKVKEHWEAIQISLKNYRNSGTPPNTSSPSYFRASAEKGEHQSFRWQGKFGQDNLPEGEFHAESLSAETVFSLLGIDGISEATGTADMKGFLTVYKNKSEQRWQTKVIEGSLSFNDLNLKENSQVWLSSPVLKVTGLNQQGDAIHLGKIETAASINLNTHALPEIVQRVGVSDTGISLDSLNLRGDISLSGKENSATKPLELKNITLQTINLSNPEKTSDRDNFSLQAEIGENGTLHARGRVHLKPLAVNVATSFKQIKSSQLLPWFSDNPLISQLQAQLNGEGDFTFPDVNYSGKLELSAGSLTKQRSTYFSWDGLNIPDFRFSKDPLHLGGMTVHLDSPRFRHVRSETSQHDLMVLNSFFQNHIPAKHTNPKSTTIVPKLAFEKIEVSSGTVSLMDQRLSPPWSAEMTMIDGLVENFSSNHQAPAARFSFSGLLDSVPFKLDGINHFFDSSARGEYDFLLEEYPLASFYKQLAEKTDIDSSRGSVTATIHSTWHNEVIEQQNQLQLNNIEAIDDDSLLALTLALVSDQNDSFTLTTTSQRDLASASYPIFADSLAALNKLVIKASVSPLLLATGDFSELIGNEYAEFQPGQIILSGKGQESISSFSRLLSTHPRLAITVTGSADSEIDGAALKRELELFEQQRVAKENLKRAEALEKATEIFMAKKIKEMEEAGISTEFVEQEIPQELYSKYAPIEPVPVAIDEKMLRDLADQRAQVIKDFFIQKLALQPERITIAKPARISSGTASPGNRVPITLNAYSETLSFDYRGTTNQPDHTE